MSRESLRRSALGEVLISQFLRPRKISLIRLAKDCRMSLKELLDIVEGVREIDPLQADKLARALGTSVQYWMSMAEETSDWSKFQTISEPQAFADMQTTQITNSH